MQIIYIYIYIYMFRTFIPKTSLLRGASNLGVLRQLEEQRGALGYILFAAAALGGTQTGSYQTGSYQKGRLIPPKPKLSYVIQLFITVLF